MGNILQYVMYEIDMNIVMACHYNKRIEPEPEPNIISHLFPGVQDVYDLEDNSTYRPPYVLST